MNETNKDEEKKALANKRNMTRELINIKALMDKRKEQRSMALYNFVNLKYQNALIICRQLLFTSQKIWKEFHDQYITQFEQNYFFRTSKAKQLSEYLLDCLMISKIFVRSKKKDDMLEIIDKLEIPEMQVIDKDKLDTKEEVLRYNEIKEVQTRVVSVLLSFIQTCKQQKILVEAQKLFNIYVKFVEKNYGPFEFAMACFQFGNFYYESKDYKKAIDKYESCLAIRKKNTLNDGFVDVLINLSICLRQMGRIKDAIHQVKMAIQISKDLGQSQQKFIDDYYLFLSKMELQNADFKSSYKNFLITYKMRQSLPVNDPKRVQIQLNLLFFYKTLYRSIKQPAQQFFNMKDKKEIEGKKKQAQQIMKMFEDNILNREQFAKYNDFNQRLAHLTLNITEQFFDDLNSEQVLELDALILKLNSCSFQKGLSELIKSSFFAEKKMRESLIAANPIIKTYSSKEKK